MCMYQIDTNANWMADLGGLVRGLKGEIRGYIDIKLFMRMQTDQKSYVAIVVLVAP